MHIDKAWEDLHDWQIALKGAARLQLLDLEGREISLEERRTVPSQKPSKDEASRGLSAMRRYVASRADAAILFGGKLDGYHGAMPGIAEEANCAVKAGKPLFILGGYGGCARALCRIMNLFCPRTRTRRNCRPRSRRPSAGGASRVTFGMA